MTNRADAEAAGAAQRTPPKIPRPAPAPLAESPAVARLHGRVTDPLLSSATRATLIEEFWQRIASRTPLVESSTRQGEYVVTFLWRDPQAADVLLFVNRLTDERNISDSLMRHVPGTDIWHLSYRMAGDWRASYAFLPHRGGSRLPWADAEGQVALRASLDRGMADPRNPDGNLNKGGTLQSVVALPAAPRQPWLALRPGVPKGVVEPATLPSGQRCWLYLPRKSDGETGVAQAGAALPLLIVFDGDVWTSTQDLPTTLDNLIADGEIPPLAAVLLDSGDRATRWTNLDVDGGADRLVAETALPWARNRLPVSADPARTIACGQSLGGLSALLTAARYPDTVGAVIAQSASLWQNGALARITAKISPRLRFYLEAGTQEWVLLGPNRELARCLDAAGADVTMVEYNGGHDYACWRGGIADGLRWIARDWS